MPVPHRQPLSQSQRDQLDAARSGLLLVHKALLDEERIRYEREHGRIEGSVAFLQLTLHDPWFAWLRPLSELIVQIDELAWTKDDVEAGQPESLLAQARRMVQPDENGDDFQKQYFRLIQESTDVAATHAQWKTSFQP